MNLVIDIGNTVSKLAVFSKNEVIFSDKIEKITPEKINGLITAYPLIKHALISTVAVIPENITNELKVNQIDTLVFNTTTLLPVTNTYKTPETLGQDRIAAVVGAYKLYNGKDVLVIDAGTAITFDLIDSKGQYLGGNISPGLDMRYKALNHFTAKLPLLKANAEFSLIGESTNQAIINGVQNGLIFEIEGYIRNLKTLYPNIIVLMTGGNGSFFEDKLKNSIFVVSDLTLIGLNFILEYNTHA